MATDIFLELDGIPGESKDKDFKGQVDVLSCVWTMKTGPRGTSQEGVVPSFSDVGVRKRPDRATPSLMIYCASGKHIQKAKLTFRQPGDGAVAFLEYSMSDLIITKFSHVADGTQPGAIEIVGLNFTKIKIEYFMVQKSGARMPAGNFGWDIPRNIKL